MSGHSKWHKIRRQKGGADAKRGNVFTKHSKLIAVAARQGGDPDMNPSLRLAIDKARADNMPKSNIERAIKKGTGELKEGGAIEEVYYEGYGPGGVAIYIYALTDNRNRTVSDLRKILERNGGNLGQSGCVAWMFERKGNITINLSDNSGKSVEDLELIAIDAGAEDIETIDSSGINVVTSANNLENVKKSMEGQGVAMSLSEINLVPKETVNITDPKTASKILKLMEALDENDDVNEVSSNFDIPEDLIEG